MSTEMVTDDQAKDLSALVIWLSSFESFNFSIEEAARVEQIAELLSSTEVTRAISRIAEEICESPVETAGSADHLWTSLLMLTSTLAKPLLKEYNTGDSRMNPIRLKLYVLSNLLDCAVQSPNMHRRRKYIERIMKLDKPVQKVLMSLIERRVKKTPKKNRSPAPQLPATGRQTASPLVPTREALQQKKSIFESPSSTAVKKGSTPSSLLKRSPSKTPRASPLIHSAMTPNSALSSRRSTPQTTPHSVKFDTPIATSFTPSEDDDSSDPPSSQPTKLVRRSVTREAVADVLLSPGTLESPGRVQDIVSDLRDKTLKYETILDNYKQRETDLKTKLDDMQATHRQEMLQIESKSMDREQETLKQYHDCIEKLQSQLKVAQVKSEEGEKALADLQKAREEMEMLNQNQGALAETSEKLRKYKERIDELQDAKETLEREQEAHGKSVDEIVRLENELKTLFPLKRQLEDYKLRAIEAEVKLVECQDYLQRIEKEARDQSSVNENLRKGVVMQQEQVNELQRRIQEETAEAQNANGVGVGDGLSELNPALKEELLRLRNENVQLRAFAEKRSNDAVQRMVEKLDDTKRLGERYKDEYLASKGKLEETVVVLEAAEKRQIELEEKMLDWKERTETAEKNEKDLLDQVTRIKSELESTKTDMSDQITKAQDELNSTKEILASVEEKNTTLQSEVTEWMGKCSELENKSIEQATAIEQLESDLESTLTSVQIREEEVKLAREQLTQREASIAEQTEAKEKVSEQLANTEGKLAKAVNDVEQSNKACEDLKDQLKEASEAQAKLTQQLEEEKMKSEQVLEEAHKSIETTRELMENKSNKDLDEMEEHYTQLLQDEKDMAQRRDEDAIARINSIEKRWKHEYNDLENQSKEAVRKAMEDSNKRLEVLKKEHAEELSKAKKQADEVRENLISKGKTMIAEAKAKAKDEMGQLYDEKIDLEEKLERAVQEGEEVEQLLRGKISMLKNKLDLSAGQVNNLTNESEDLQERVLSLERERANLQEDNDRCRRQLRGRYGADDKVQGQLEKLQREYNTLLDEHRELKKKARHSQNADLNAISENEVTEGGSGFSRANKEAIKEMRMEYEAVIDSLSDEKRELIMKHSSAVTDVKKAEQRAWEAEKKITDLKDHITSLELDLERSDLRASQMEEACLAENRSPTTNMSYFSASSRDVERTPKGIPASPSTKATIDRRRSPQIDRAMKEKAEQEYALRSQLRSLAGKSNSHQQERVESPTDLCRLGVTRSTPEQAAVLSPSKRIEHDANRSGDVYGLGVETSYQKSPNESFTSSYYHEDPRAQTFLNSTRNSPADDGEDKPQCQQS